MTQDQAFEILKTGVNVFLTGEPGSGKTYLVNKYASYLRGKGIDMAVTASTGIAATHINGMTIHSWSGIQIKKALTKQDLHKIATSKYITKRVNRAKVLLIDEISMLPPRTLTMVDMVCREIKQDQSPFGGMQVIFSGDFFQLPPVMDNIDALSSKQIDYIDSYEVTNGVTFAFDSPAWIKSEPVSCYLTEQHRQEDDQYLSILSAIRHDSFNDNHLGVLKTRQVNIHSVPLKVPRLYSHNSSVDSLNINALNKINSKSFDFLMTGRGPEPLISKLKDGCLSPDVLILKSGASVMFTKNNQKEGFANGTLGEVVGFVKDSNYPIIKTRNGKEIIVEPMEWTIDEGDKVLAGITQIPLRLAWAITVHKSQGMNLDEAVIDLAGVFEYGQGYVALSRVRRLSGLYLCGWNEKTFKLHPDVLEKDIYFRQQSEKAMLKYNLSLKKKVDNKKANTPPNGSDGSSGFSYDKYK